MLGLTLIGEVFHFFGQSGRKAVGRNWHILLCLFIWLTASWLFLANRDLMLPLSFGHPLFPYQDVLIFCVTYFFKLVLIGAMVKNIAPIMIMDGRAGRPPIGNMFRWVLISLVFACTLTLTSVVQIHFEFGGAGPLGPGATIAIKLGFVYLQLALLWIAIHAYVGARRIRLDLIIATTIIYLATTSLISTLIFYMPVVAPFWFGLDQLGGTWTALVQTVLVLAETGAALIYAAFIASAAFSLAERKDASS